MKKATIGLLKNMQRKRGNRYEFKSKTMVVI